MICRGCNLQEVEGQVAVEGDDEKLCTEEIFKGLLEAGVSASLVPTEATVLASG